MGKLSKVATTAHDKALSLIDSDKPLSFDDKRFILEHYNPMASHNVTKDAVYFTPWAITHEMMVETLGYRSKRVLDLGAGIGMLSFHLFTRAAFSSHGGLDIVCLEKNPEFCRIGERLLPEAKWICGDMFDRDLIDSLGRFDEVISNPPYGLFLKKSWLSSKLSQYAAAEVAMTVSSSAVFLLAQADCPFKYSGQRGFHKVDLPKYTKFSESTGIEFEMNCGIDLSTCKTYKDWPKMNFEIVNVSRSDGFAPAAQAPQIQLGLFEQAA